MNLKDGTGGFRSSTVGSRNDARSYDLKAWSVALKQQPQEECDKVTPATATVQARGDNGNDQSPLLVGGLKSPLGGHAVSVVVPMSVSNAWWEEPGVEKKGESSAFTAGDHLARLNSGGGGAGQPTRKRSPDGAPGGGGLRDKALVWPPARFMDLSPVSVAQRRVSGGAAQGEKRKRDDGAALTNTSRVVKPKEMASSPLGASKPPGVVDVQKSEQEESRKHDDDNASILLGESDKE